MDKRLHSIFVGIVTAASVSLSACASEVEGFWTGTASADGETTAINITITDAGEEDYGASLDLPDVGVAGWPAQTVMVDGEAVTVSIPSDNGLQPIAMTHSGDTLSGMWQMPGFETPAVVSLSRGTPPGEGYQEMDVTFMSGDLSMGGTIILPTGEGPFPGIVFLHGSGDTPRAVNRFAAEQFSARGIASIIFDKRGTGSSEGAWREVGFDELAADGIAAAETLAAVAQVDGRRIGFSGQSQGGWIGPLAADTWGQAAFVIALSGPATTPAEEGHWSVVWNMQQAGYGDEDIAAANAVMDLWDEGMRTGDFTAFDAAYDEIRDAPWYEASGINIFSSNVPDWVANWYARVLDFDPVPVIWSMDAPMLSLLGSVDASIPAERSAEILHGLANEGVPVEVIYYEGYDHTLRRVSEAPQRWPNQPADLYDVQAAFIDRVTAE